MSVFFIIPNLHLSTMSYSQLALILFTVSNSIVYLNTEYIGKPLRGNTLEAALRHTVELQCIYTGAGTGQFVGWFKSNETTDVSVNTDKPGHYVVKNTDNSSTLLIKIFVQADTLVTKWYVKTDKTGNEEPYPCQFSKILAIPSPQGIEDNEGVVLETPHGSLRRSEDKPLTLKCLIEPSDQHNNNDVVWKFSKDEKTFITLPDGIIQDGNAIHFSAVQKYHRGYYRCTLNKFSFTILLRVKDRLAALWPFIGIVVVVLVLVIIILIFEKRQKSNKKSATTDDDEQDRASDPLVRTTARSSDNDNKKRAVKA